MTHEETLLPTGTPAVRSGEPDDLLRKFRRALEEMYGDRLDRVVLFGSRARGDARPDSDYDVAVFLKTLPDYWAEAHRLAGLRVDIFDDDRVFFNTLPFASSSYEKRTPIMHEIRKDGIDF